MVEQGWKEAFVNQNYFRATLFCSRHLLFKRQYNHSIRLFVVKKKRLLLFYPFCCQHPDDSPPNSTHSSHKTCEQTKVSPKNPLISYAQRLQTLWSTFMSQPLIIPKNIAILTSTLFLVVVITLTRAPSYGDWDPLEQKVALFNIILEDIQRAYVEKVDVDKLFETGVNAMLGSLDPYTQFENHIEAQEMNVKAMGRYGGVGLVIAKDIRDKDQIIIISSFERYAFDAGLRPGDRLLQVDGHSVVGQDLEGMTQLLRGDAGTKVTVRVLRPGISEPFDVTLTRQLIRVSDVPAYGFIGNQQDGVGYIRLQSFSSNACTQVRNAIQELQKSGQLKSLVLDLRDNPGGLLSSAIDVSELFVPKVNSRTASAAEIVAGAIQDNDLGVVFGSQTFGKGLVQNVDQLPFQTALKYTVGKYYTPSGRCIQSSSYSLDHEKLKITVIDQNERKIFKTKNGRSVFDSGGIEPDIQWEETPIHEWRRLLHQQGLLFYFANDYAAKHPEGIHSNFHVDDALYRKFKNYVKDQIASGSFSMASRFEEPLASLRSDLEQQGYRETSKNLEKVADSLKLEMENELEHFDHTIRHDLEDSIRARFQPDSARIMAGLLRDEEILQTKQVISDGILYAKLLSPQNKKAAV
ncbi:carboxyl-terminal processing protease isoform 1 [Galdieria sulphuraria]|uniref:Carboxyl-terminal processing protease isoform 1 n=1 Tax=Galdieria sulphuraria TaxID=130081 RepID=M2VZU0_GALSU|nr:carboxyl-terminal processing protease isoform 1 [Galdieria sulphuraria]EME28856.1 carboxyl-terminal processing protease isoform 1 [Galdieria sulphuraria]|eukprot:XP_005705376.1 carboxyl-terminal processing protease isoform 1 [Galdieria sulphuraria]